MDHNEGGGGIMIGNANLPPGSQTLSDDELGLLHGGNSSLSISELWRYSTSSQQSDINVCISINI